MKTLRELFEERQNQQGDTELELEEQAAATSTPRYSQEQQDMGNILGTALGSIGAAGLRGLGDDARAKSFKEEALAAGGVFAKKEQERQALNEKIKDRLSKLRKERLGEGLSASKEDREERAEERAESKESRDQGKYEADYGLISEPVSTTLNKRLSEAGIKGIDTDKITRPELDQMIKLLPPDKKAQAVSAITTPASPVQMQGHIEQQKRAGNPAYANINTIEELIKAYRRNPSLLDLQQDRLTFALAAGTAEKLIGKGEQQVVGAEAKLQSVDEKEKELLGLAEKAGDEYLGQVDARVASTLTSWLGADNMFRSKNQAEQAKALRDLKGKSNASNITDFAREFLGSQVTDGERASLSGFLIDVNQAANVADAKAAINNLFKEVRRLQELRKAEGRSLKGEYLSNKNKLQETKEIDYNSMSDEDLDAAIQRQLGGK